jgi:SPP1 gp7 family putative phage head morphogenesis protein
MSELTDAAMAWRKRVMEREQSAADEILKRYSTAYSRIEASQRLLLLQIREKQQQGETVSRAWLQRQERYKTLLQQIRVEVEAFADYAQGVVKSSVLEAIGQGEEAARQLAFAALDSETQSAEVLAQWNRLSSTQLQNLSGVMSTGSPVGKLFDTLGQTTAAAVRDTLFVGLAQGQNPRQIARQLRSVSGYSATRALTISRTETLRAYRMASLESYRANDDIVQGWIWLASLSVRTCAACLALHGRVFRLEEAFGSHPNCRCTTVPITTSSPDFGESGEDWLARQSDERQLQILGKGKLEAYQRGDITLQDCIHEEDSRIWGMTRSEASLKEALENATRQERETVSSLGS